MEESMKQKENVLRELHTTPQTNVLTYNAEAVAYTFERFFAIAIIVQLAIPPRSFSSLVQRPICVNQRHFFLSIPGIPEATHATNPMHGSRGAFDQE